MLNSGSSKVLASGMIEKFIYEVIKREKWIPKKKFVVFHLGKSDLLEDDGNGIYIGITPFEPEKEYKFKASVQIKRILSKGRPMIIFQAEAYEEVLKDRSYSSIYSLMAEEIYAVMRALDEENQSILSMIKRPVLALPLKGEDGIPDFALQLYKSLAKIGDFKLLLVGDKLSPKDLEKIQTKLSDLGLLFSVSVNKSGALITGLVEGDLSIMSYDPVAKILGDRVLDLEPEEKVEVSIPYLDRID